MADRLVDLYSIGNEVEILLGEQWLLGRVVRHEFPAVWVQTPDGFAWFVTNGRRIRQCGVGDGREEWGVEGRGARGER